MTLRHEPVFGDMDGNEMAANTRISGIELDDYRGSQI